LFQVDLFSKVENFPFLLSTIPIFSRSYYEGETAQITHDNIASKLPVGYGPYKYADFKMDRHLKLNYHERYYEITPGFEQINIQLYPSAHQMTGDFVTGKLDFMQIYYMDHARELSRVDVNFSIIAEPIPNPEMIFLNYNLNNPILRSSGIRRALATAYNKEVYCRTGLFFNVRSAASGPVPENSWAFLRQPGRLEYNPRKALEALKEQDWNDTDGDGILERRNQQLTFELLFAEQNKYFEDLVRYIKTNLGVIGVNVREISVPYDELRQRIRSGDFQMALDFSTYYPNDMIRTFSEFFDIEGTNIQRNRLGTRSEEAVRQFLRATRETNQRRSEAIFKRLQDLYYGSFTSSYLVYRHHRYFVINKQKINNYIDGVRLISPAFWIPKQ